MLSCNGSKMAKNNYDLDLDSLTEIYNWQKSIPQCRINKSLKVNYYNVPNPNIVLNISSNSYRCLLSVKRLLGFEHFREYRQVLYCLLLMFWILKFENMKNYIRDI